MVEHVAPLPHVESTLVLEHVMRVHVACHALSHVARLVHVVILAQLHVTLDLERTAQKPLAQLKLSCPVRVVIEVPPFLARTTPSTE